MSSWGELTVVAPVATGESAAANALTSPAPTAPPTTTTVPETPPCTVDDQPAEGDPSADWPSIVVDATYALPSDFEPPDLVDVSEAGFGTGDLVREIVVADLDTLRQAAEAAGNPVSMVSAYRSHTYQAGLFDSEVEQQGQEEAQRTTARPGHSEHQLGTAIDLSNADGSPLDETFAASPTARWLESHAHEFGFVISYPDVPAERSCYQYEPWHLRYVGHEVAEAIHASGLTLREWLLTH
ncbi:MAG: M15 family metallopeptidase [Acidimicrobiales bacterium]